MTEQTEQTELDPKNRFPILYWTAIQTAAERRAAAAVYDRAGDLATAGILLLQSFDYPSSVAAESDIAYIRAGLETAGIVNLQIVSWRAGAVAGQTLRDSALLKTLGIPWLFPATELAALGLIAAAAGYTLLVQSEE